MPSHDNDPGDLVLDLPAAVEQRHFVAELGATVDHDRPSRVALALARQRLMTARFPFYQLRTLMPRNWSGTQARTWLTDPTGGFAGKSTSIARRCRTSH